MRYARNGSSAKGTTAAQELDDEATGERLSHPFAVYAAQAILGSPWAFLLLFLVLFLLSVFGALELETMRGPPTYMRESGDGLLSGFPDTRRQRDIAAIWCPRVCNSSAELRDAAGSAERATIESLSRLRQDVNICQDLEWSSGASPRDGVAAGAYAKSGVHIVELSSGAMSCIDEVRLALSGLSERLGGNITVALGGLESVARASMEREGVDAWHHMAVCIPFVAAVLAVGLGNMCRPLTAVICMGATFASTRAILVAVKKLYDPLNVDMEDQAMFFICFALNADYALFFWSRFAEERATKRGADQYKVAVEEALLRSGAVIAVSNVVMAFALCGTLFFPGLNASGQRAFLIECLSGVVLAGLYSLTLTPTLAAALPSLFDEGSPTSPSQWSAWTTALRPDTKKIWTIWARIITSKPWLFVAPVAVFVGLAPFIWAAFQFEANLDVLEICANHETAEYQAYRQMREHFNLGKVVPITFVLEARDRGLSVEPISELESGVVSLGLPFEALIEDVHLGQGTSVGSATPPASSSRPHRPLPLLLPLPLTAAAAVLADGLPSWAAGEAAHLLQRESSRMQRKGGQAGGQAGGQRAEEGLVAPASVADGRRGQASAASRAIQMPQGMQASVTLSPEFGKLACSFVGSLLTETRGRDFEIRANDVLGIWWLPGAGPDGSAGCALNFVQGLAAGAGLPGGASTTGVGISQADIEKQIHRRISSDGSRQQLMVYPMFQPTSAAAADLSYFLSDVLEPASSREFVVKGRRYEFVVRHSSIVAAQLDLTNKMQAAAPWICICVAFVGFVSVGLTFHSAFLPFKLALTVAMPLLATYGVVIAFFQLGWFEFFGLGSHGSGPDPLILYTTPCCLFGLAMDYDLFLFARVYEYRKKGYDNRSAVARALVETGPVITIAGVLFAISLVFLTLSKTPFMQYLGAIYLTGICLDVFVVRTCLAPAFLCMAETLNYWPGEMPIPRLTWGEDGAGGFAAALLEARSSDGSDASTPASAASKPADSK